MIPLSELPKILLACAVAAVIAAGVTFGVMNSGQRQGYSRVAPHAWPELTQAQVDKLSTALAKMPPREIAIVCKVGCDDLALSFDNAFESGKWKSQIETPLVDDTTGWSIGPMGDPDAAAVRRVIFEVTGVEPKLVDAHIIQDRLVLVLGRK